MKPSITSRGSGAINLAPSLRQYPLSRKRGSETSATITPTPPSKLFNTLGRIQCTSIEDWYRRMMIQHKRVVDSEKHALEMEEEEREREEEEEGVWGDRKPRQYDFADRQFAWSDAEDNSDWMRLPPHIPGPDPKGGSIENQVYTTHSEAVKTDECDLEHKKYWFTEPRGGWNSKPQWVRKPKKWSGTFATAANKERGRKSIKELEQGQRLRGVVTEIWLAHGFKVDIDYDYDGLLPMNRQRWTDFDSILDVGLPVNVIVEKVWDPEYYRWPVQLTAVNPDIQKLITPPDKWEPPVDFRGKTVAQIEANTNRRLPTEQWVYSSLQEDHILDYLTQKPPRAEYLKKRSKQRYTELMRDAFDDAQDAIEDMENY